MSTDKPEKNDNSIKITAFGKTTELGKILGSEGTVPLLNFLAEQPRQYKDIEDTVDIPKTTLVRHLNSFQLLKIIKKDPYISKGRKTHLYSLTQVGSEMMKFIRFYERTTVMPSSQQKIVEIEKKSQN